MPNHEKRCHRLGLRHVGRRPLHPNSRHSGLRRHLHFRDGVEVKDADNGNADGQIRVCRHCRRTYPGRERELTTGLRSIYFAGDCRFAREEILPMYEVQASAIQRRRFAIPDWEDLECALVQNGAYIGAGRLEQKCSGGHETVSVTPPTTSLMSAGLGVERRKLMTLSATVLLNPLKTNTHSGAHNEVLNQVFPACISMSDGRYPFGEIGDCDGSV